MSLRPLKERFKRLQTGRGRWLVASVASVQQSLKQLAPVLIFVDSEGDWHNRRVDGSFVAPELNVSSYHAVRDLVLDLWCHEYAPQAGDTVIDVGAGIGDDVLAFSRMVGPSGRVIAVEAHPRTFRCLKKTIVANKLRNVTAVNVALADKDGEIAMSTGDTYLSSSIVVGATAVHVPARRLDDLWKELGLSRVGLLKMNIEGAECAALRGMSEALRDIRHIVVSCHDFKADQGHDASMRTFGEAKRVLGAAGFDLSGRLQDPRHEVRYYLYGRRAGA